MQRLRHDLLVVGVRPERPFPFRDEILRIRKGELAICADRTAGMIGVDVGEDHLGHFDRIDACRRQIGRKLAGTLLEIAA
ncbi:hypothetical protein D3C72_2290680 [compost metagenome]